MNRDDRRTQPRDGAVVLHAACGNVVSYERRSRPGDVQSTMMLVCYACDVEITSLDDLDPPGAVAWLSAR